MAWYIAIHDHDVSVTQHGRASYMTKFESQSFRLRSKFGVAFAQQESCWRSQRLRRSQSQGARAAFGITINVVFIQQKSPSGQLGGHPIE